MSAPASRTIVDVMTGVFGKLFPQPSWRPWVLCAAAIFGLTFGLSAEDEAFILACLKRSTLPTDRARRVVLVIGRRAGKSRFASFLAVFLACFQDYSKVLAPGERGIGMVIAPDRKQARVCFRYILAFLDHVPMLAALVTSKTRDAVHLRNGISIEVHTASFRSTRGYTVVFCIVDEVAFLPQDDSAEPDHELIRSVLPAMATTNGMLILISSPHAKRGVLWRAMQEHYGKDDTDVLVWKAPTRTMNATIPEGLVESARREDATAAATEWDAEFRGDIETFLSREAIDDAVVTDRIVLPPKAGVTYSAFADPAGGGSANADDMTGAIVHMEADQIVVDAVFVRRPPFSPENTAADMASWLKAYRIAEVVGDKYGGEWPSEQFRKYGITYRPADAPKSAIYREFGAIVNSGRVELPDDPRLCGQLAALERRSGRSGRETIDHPPGSHDDVANAVAGAVVHVSVLNQTAGVGFAVVPWL
jgi:hypothetical protein